MIAGHFALAAGVKSRERQAPLWALMLATVWLDIIFAPLVAVGIESIRSGDGYGSAIIHADYTHSLVGALVLAVLFGLVSARPWGARTGAVLGSVVFSHWLLDLIVHRADMPILPGNAGDLPRAGLGLWRVPVASVAVELGLVVAGSYLYRQAASQTARATGDEQIVGRANLVSALLLAAGLITLAVDALIG